MVVALRTCPLGVPIEAKAQKQVVVVALGDPPVNSRFDHLAGKRNYCRSMDHLLPTRSLDKPRAIRQVKDAPSLSSSNSCRVSTNSMPSIRSRYGQGCADFGIFYPFFRVGSGKGQMKKWEKVQKSEQEMNLGPPNLLFDTIIGRSISAWRPHSSTHKHFHISSTPPP